MYHVPTNFGNDPEVTEALVAREPQSFPLLATLASAGTGLFIAYTAPGLLLYLGPIPFMYCVYRLWPWLTQLGKGMGATHMEVVNHDK